MCLCFPELFFRGFLPGLGLPCPARWLPVLIGKPEVTRQLCGGFLFPQPVQGSYKINHIPICTTSEAVETLVQLHAGGLIVVERAASHPVSVYPDSVIKPFSSFIWASCFITKPYSPTSSFTSKESMSQFCFAISFCKIASIRLL